MKQLLSNTKSLIFRVGPALKEQWVAQCKKQKISQNDAAVGLISWFLVQDEDVQLIVCDQKPMREDTLAMILQRLKKAQVQKIAASPPVPSGKNWEKQRGGSRLD